MAGLSYFLPLLLTIRPQERWASRLPPRQRGKWDINKGAPRRPSMADDRGEIELRVFQLQGADSPSFSALHSEKERYITYRYNTISVSSSLSQTCLVSSKQPLSLSIAYRRKHLPPLSVIIIVNYTPLPVVKTDPTSCRGLAISNSTARLP